MRVAYVAGTALPSRVAGAVNVLKTCRSLAAARHEVTLYARVRQTDAAAVFYAYGTERRFELVSRVPPGLRLTKKFLYPVRMRVAHDGADSETQSADLPPHGGAVAA